MNRARVIWVVIFLVTLLSFSYAISPNPPDILFNITSSGPSQTMGSMLNTTGGTISTVNFFTKTQNPRWKGFVGNITGKFALQDANNFSLYDWTITIVQGEIYATRNSGTVDWPNIDCATYQNISFEQTDLGFLKGDADSINNTFNETAHDQFYAGDTLISVNSCPSTNLTVNTTEVGLFQELLLFEQNIIYTGLLEDAEIGFSGEPYDYQLIVPENTNQSKASELYYFYIELI
ncbi:hypothetical protein GOV09_03375 [Candidatus Woesearchaeota archaeon]|nr:hypothetical protein [Candidatus Woesearchaeota archaeon]